MKLIELNNISKTFSSKNDPVGVLNNVSLSINKGDFLAIRGLSGCGKTTLLNILGCLLKPDSGEIMFRQQRITEMDEKELAEFRNQKIGFIFQGSHLIPTLDVLENILVPLIFSPNSKELRRLKKARALELIEELGLKERVNHLPHQLSLGQCRRVAIARALINDPEVLLADEPTNDLDSVRAAQIADIFSKLHQQGMTIILVTHLTELASQAPKSYIMEGGRLELWNQKQAIL
ncbi:MAG: ABC transporter ATP-binding protein [Bacillota bacterium]|nr:ABC transporter ATP-binding protein [Bacillota bacterium]